MNFSFWGYFSSNYPYIFPFFHPIFYTLPFHISPHQPYFPLPGVGGDFQNTGPWVRYKDKIEFFFLIIKKKFEPIKCSLTVPIRYVAKKNVPNGEIFC